LKSQLEGPVSIILSRLSIPEPVPVQKNFFKKFSKNWTKNQNMELFLGGQIGHLNMTSKNFQKLKKSISRKKYG